ncbi:DNA-binding protein [Bacillus spongiae]|uniref:DNA-binding protein n=1 Tax=Bacillus spongiae TaxID=2683610 RepID=A0ABU8HFS4_9BACI
MYNFESREKLAEYFRSEVVNTTEATKILNCTRQNLYKLVKKNVLNPIKETSKDRFFWKADIYARKEQVENKKKL